MAPLPHLLTEAIARLAASPDRAVMLIDGGAGAGKTTLAQQVVADWPAPESPQLVSLDDLYPGWGGLAAGSAAVPAVIRGDGYRRWDWQRSRPGEWQPLDRDRGLVVEGCGAITPASRPLAGLAVWLEVDEPTRKARALDRDGELFAAHWDEWSAQEAVHWGADHPRELAELVIEAD